MASSLNDYEAARKEFHRAVSKLVSLSAHLGGTPSRHGRQYWSSILVAKMALTCMTLDKILPRECSAMSKDLWDLTSVAALLRILVENYLLLHWLCVETEDGALWQFRITALTLVDNRARYRMTVEVEGAAEPEDFKNAQQSLADRLSTMALFQTLAPGRQKDLLKGIKLPFIQDEVIDSLDLDRATFRRFYRYLSAFVHTGTVSFFRMEAHGRGNGEFNDYEATAILACMEFAKDTIRAAASSMEQLHAV